MFTHADCPPIEHHYLVKAAHNTPSSAKEVFVDAVIDLKDVLLDSYRTLESDLDHLKVQADSTFEKNRTELEELKRKQAEDFQHKIEKEIQHFSSKLEDYREKYHKNKGKIAQEQCEQIEQNIEKITQKLSEMKKNLKAE